MYNNPTTDIENIETTKAEITIENIYNQLDILERKISIILQGAETPLAVIPKTTRLQEQLHGIEDKIGQIISRINI